MAVFSTNQARQVYVVSQIADFPFKDSTPKGALAILPHHYRQHLNFAYNGMGGVTGLDKLAVKDIDYVKLVKASRMKTPLKRVKLTLDTNCVDVKTDGNCSVTTLAYRILVRNYIGLSDADVYIKHINMSYKGKTQENKYKLLALETINSFSDEDNKLFTIYLEEDGTDPKKVGTLTEVTKKTDPATLTAEYTGLVIEEKPQPWTRGKKQGYPINFEISLLPAEDEHFTIDEWAFVNPVEPAKFIGNGQKMADLEVFGYGERGDIYRDGNPMVTFTPEFLVDPTKEYDTINIHYHYEGTCEDSQKSEKDITFIIPAGNAAYNSLKSTLSSLGVLMMEVV